MFAKRYYFGWNTRTLLYFEFVQKVTYHLVHTVYCRCTQEVYTVLILYIQRYIIRERKENNSRCCVVL